MWKTPLGERVLRGPEAELFKHGIGSLLDEFQLHEEAGEEAYTIGISLFDQLTQPQKLQMIEAVATALLDKKVPAPPANALTDAIVGTVYEQLWVEIQIELDNDADREQEESEPITKENKKRKAREAESGFEKSDFRFWWRRVVRDCLGRMDFDDLPEETELEGDLWHMAVYEARDRVLRHRGWDNPRAMARMRAIQTLGLGAVRPYFQVRPPDPTTIPAKTVEASLREIVKSLGEELDQAIRRRPPKQ